ncbi:MAG: hypothetical protein IJE25_07875 [Clostridia bacterium]|nr:hypothetical protein [Clostridia bacterium]
MKTNKILNTETEPYLISSLPARPNLPYASGGINYSSSDLREAFDKLPLLIVERLNSLISEIEDSSVCESIETGIMDSHTLADMFNDIKIGNFVWYLTMDGEPVSTILYGIMERLDRLEAEVFK